MGKVVMKKPAKVAMKKPAIMEKTITKAEHDKEICCCRCKGKDCYYFKIVTEKGFLCYSCWSNHPCMHDGKLYDKYGGVVMSDE